MGLLDKLVTKLTKKPSDEAAEETVSEAAEAAAEITDTEDSNTEEIAEAAEVVEEAAHEDDTAENDAAEKTDSAPGAGLKKTLLIVDGDEQSCSFLRKALSSYELVFARNGVEAVHLLKEEGLVPSLILLDVMMNGNEGLDILRLMKEQNKLSDISVIALASEPDIQKKSLELGAADIIPKPFPDASVVYARTQRCIELSDSKELIRITERDSSTDLYNIAYFKHYVRLYDKLYPDADMDAAVAVISNFHMLREHYGKRYADDILQKIGSSVKDVQDKFGGYGCRRDEDSFLLYCPHTDNYNKLLTDISAGLESDQSTAGKARMCLGVYSDVSKDVPIEQRFEFASIAAQSVINSYTDTIGIYDADLKKAAQFREQILSEFIPSLEEKRFKIYFQPKFDIRGDEPVLYSAEALVRWDHPQLGMLSPGAFISLFEENGLITRLDRYVWGEAAAQIRRWKDEYGYSVPVSVNISRIDMLLPLLKDIFKDIIKEYSLNDDDIILEITESADNSSNDQILSAAKELRGMGMGLRIEMGNFGAGYSSIGMLSNMPIDALKIDMNFVHNSLGDNKDMRMIELIIDIADYLHVPVVAEGVETEEQYLLLKALGCDLVQGFYFSKPVPKEEFDHFIKEDKTKTHIIPDNKRNYVSISKALTGEYERIFYIDINTDHYMQFYSGSKGEFRITTGGKDFFADLDEVVLNIVVAEDRERIGKLLSKGELIEWIGADKPLSTHFKRAQNGTLCTLETIRTRNQDDHHIVIGIRHKKRKS